MKKLTILFILLISAVAFSQAENFETDYLTLLKKDILKEAKALVKDNLELTDEQAEKFWPLYDEYISKLDKLSSERLNLITEYMMDYYDLSDEKAAELLDKSLELEQKRLDLRKEYLGKMKAVLPAKLVGKFFQIESYIQTLITLQRQSTIPLIRTEESK